MGTFMRRSFAVVIERDPDGGFIASVPALPGCHTQGETLDELRGNVREAVELYLEDEDVPEVLPEFVGVEQIDLDA